jgi:hypothetical protein
VEQPVDGSLPVSMVYEEVVPPPTLAPPLS